MLNRIPLSVTKSVCNWCTWSVHRRTRIQDEKLDQETLHEKVNGACIGSAEPEPLGGQDAVIILSQMPENISGTLLKIWVKDLDFELEAENSYLVMESRKTPCGQNLPLLQGYYKVVQSHTQIGTRTDQWITLFKIN